MQLTTACIAVRFSRLELRLLPDHSFPTYMDRWIQRVKNKPVTMQELDRVAVTVLNSDTVIEEIGIFSRLGNISSKLCTYTHFNSFRDGNAFVHVCFLLSARYES